MWKQILVFWHQRYWQTFSYSRFLNLGTMDRHLGCIIFCWWESDLYYCKDVWKQPWSLLINSHPVVPPKTSPNITKCPVEDIFTPRWKSLSQTSQEKCEMTQIIKTRDKQEDATTNHWNVSDYKKILWTTVCPTQLAT